MHVWKYGPPFNENDPMMNRVSILKTQEVMMNFNTRSLLPALCAMALLTTDVKGAQESQASVFQGGFTAGVGLGVALVGSAYAFLHYTVRGRRILYKYLCVLGHPMETYVKRDYIAAIKCFLENEASWRPEIVQQILCAAVRHGRGEIIDVLLRRGISLAQHIVGLDLVFKARRQGHTGVVRTLLQVLIDEGANVNMRDREGRESLLDYAAMYGLEGITRSLIQSGALVNARNVRSDGGLIALHWAAKCGHEGVARILLESGAEVDAEDRAKIEISAYRYPAGYRSSSGRNWIEYVGRRFSKLGYSWMGRGASTPLHYASIGNHEGVIHALIEHGADVNRAAGQGGATPLHCAMRGKKAQTPESRARVGRVLVRAGAALTSDLIPAMADVSPATPEGRRVLSYDLKLYRELAQLRDERVRVVREVLQDGRGVSVGPDVSRLIMEMEQPESHLEYLRGVDNCV